jgi:hypothetical protein
MNKNTVLVGRGGFEPKRAKRNPLQIKAFSRYSPFVRQNEITPFATTILLVQ